MNNWRLLLLAVVAVFQPIASFTDSNLIDGRQQCCDRISSAPLQDTRSSLYGPYRLGKTTSALRRLNYRDETREDLRYELRQRDSIFSRSSTERPLVEFRGRAAKQDPSEIARSSRVEHRLQRFTDSPSHELQLDGRQREETARFIRDLKQQDASRRSVDRTSRETLERRNDRVYANSPQESFFRDEYRTERFGNERLSRNLFDSQREMHREQIRSVDRRITLNRDARRVVSRTQDDVNVEGSNNINTRQRITRERMSAVRRESLIRPDTRRYSEHNNERRDLPRNNGQRLTLSANTRLVDRIRDMPNRFNGRMDTRESSQRIRTNQRLSIDSDRREHKERRDNRQQNKENINRSASSERRTQVARRITRESRTINVLNNQNNRNVDGQREIRHESMPKEIQDKIRENPDHRLTRERIHVDQRNIRESRLMNAQNTRDDADRREIKQKERKISHMDRRDIRESRMINVGNTRDVVDRRENKQDERITRPNRNENRGNLEQRVARERIQTVQRDIRKSGFINARSTRDVADRRVIRQNERLARDTWEENRDQRLSRERNNLMDRRDIRESRLISAQSRKDISGQREIRQNERLSKETRDGMRENQEQGLSRERIQMDQRDIRETRAMNARNKRDDADRREIRQTERMTREAGDENRENQEQKHSHERIQIDRKDIHESRLMNVRNTRYATDSLEIKQNARMSRETGDENRKNKEQKLSRERVQMARRDIRESRLMNTRNERVTAERRDIRHNERMTRETREENRDNVEQKLSRERNQKDRRDIRESRLNARNTRDSADQRENRKHERMTRETRNENKENREEGLSRERKQMDRRDIRESRLTNARNMRGISNRREIRNNERLTREARDENRDNLELRLSRERIQMDRRNIRESKLTNARITRDIANRREIKNNVRLTREAQDENRDNLELRLSRERIQMDRRNIRESRLTNARITRDNANRREIKNNERLTREARDENKDNQELRLSRERIQMDRKNIRESRNMNIATRTERDVESQREIRTDMRLPIENRENPDHILARERIQMDRRNIRESRIMNTQTVRDLSDRTQESRQVDRQNTQQTKINRVTRNERSVETDTENRRERGNNDRLSRQIRNYRATRERRADSKSTDRINVERDRSMMDRRARSADTRNFREIRLSRSADSERRSEVSRSQVEYSPNIENRERETIDARSRNVDLARNRARNSMMVEKMEPENDFTVANWQYVLYTLQAAYLCALFMQMLTPSRTEKTHKTSLRWLPVSSHYNPIKVD